MQLVADVWRPVRDVLGVLHACRIERVTSVLA